MLGRKDRNKTRLSILPNEVSILSNEGEKPEILSTFKYVKSLKQAHVFMLFKRWLFIDGH